MEALSARPGRALMVQGATSGAGKSVLVAGLCRVAARRGLRVAPFKPQNMSLNSAVADDGGEIARAQALQCQAARVPSCVDMNPVLLKPSGDTRAQLVVLGRPLRELEAGAFQDWKAGALPLVLQAFGRLAARFDAVIAEGAGSPAEVNLRANDIANMGFAEAADCPVLLVADIDRGGVFAHFLGTLDCLSASERARIAGLVINRFRGDRALLEPGIRWLEEKTGKRVLGVLPFLHGLYLDEEDGFGDGAAPAAADAFRVVVPVPPRISNHTDFDALRMNPRVNLAWVGPGAPIPPADLVVLPGSKNVREDLAFLRAAGWEAALQRHLRYGGRVIGICGGMQMLGRRIHDPDGVEGEPGSCDGFGLLDLETTLTRDKTLENVSGTLFPAGAQATPFSGYEIHMGVSSGAALARPAALLGARPDGALSADGAILATYVHGLFDQPQACAALLAWAGCNDAAPVDLNAMREASLDRLADAIQTHLDLSLMSQWRNAP